MADPIRLPLVEATEPRSAGTDKDSLPSNLFFEKAQNGTVYAVKRPGLTSYASASGQAQGIFVWNDSLFQFVEDPYQLYRILHDGTRFMIIGSYTNYNVFTSDNGLNWSVVDTGIAVSSSPLGFAYNGSVYCATTANAIPAKSIVSSDGGVTWTSNNLPSNHDYVLASDGSSTFLAVRRSSSSSTVYTSTDGITWTPRTLPGAISARGVGFVLGKFVICSQTTTTVYTSADGVTWNTSTGGISDSGLAQFVDNGSVAVAVNGLSTSTNIIIASSTDGENWTNRQTISGSQGYGVIHDGTKFIVSVGARYYTSSNGSSWTLTQSVVGSQNQGLYGAATSSNVVFIDNSFASLIVFNTVDNGTTWSFVDFPGVPLYSATIV